MRIIQNASLVFSVVISFIGGSSLYAQDGDAIEMQTNTNEAADDSIIKERDALLDIKDQLKIIPYSIEKKDLDNRMAHYHRLFDSLESFQNNLSKTIAMSVIESDYRKVYLEAIEQLYKDKPEAKEAILDPKINAIPILLYTGEVGLFLDAFYERIYLIAQNDRLENDVRIASLQQVAEHFLTKVRLANTAENDREKEVRKSFENTQRLLSITFSTEDTDRNFASKIQFFRATVALQSTMVVLSSDVSESLQPIRTILSHPQIYRCSDQKAFLCSSWLELIENLFPLDKEFFKSAEFRSLLNGLTENVNDPEIATYVKYHFGNIVDRHGFLDEFIGYSGQEPSIDPLVSRVLHESISSRLKNNIQALQNEEFKKDFSKLRLIDKAMSLYLVRIEMGRKNFFGFIQKSLDSDFANKSEEDILAGFEVLTNDLFFDAVEIDLPTGFDWYSLAQAYAEKLKAKGFDAEMVDDKMSIMQQKIQGLNSEVNVQLKKEWKIDLGIGATPRDALVISEINDGKDSETKLSLLKLEEAAKIYQVQKEFKKIYPEFSSFKTIFVRRAESVGRYRKKAEILQVNQEHAPLRSAKIIESMVNDRIASLQDEMTLICMAHRWSNGDAIVMNKEGKFFSSSNIELDLKNICKPRNNERSLTASVWSNINRHEIKAAADAVENNIYAQVLSIAITGQSARFAGLVGRTSAYVFGKAGGLVRFVPNFVVRAAQFGVGGKYFGPTRRAFGFAGSYLYHAFLGSLSFTVAGHGLGAAAGLNPLVPEFAPDKSVAENMNSQFGKEILMGTAIFAVLPLMQGATRWIGRRAIGYDVQIAKFGLPTSFPIESSFLHRQYMGRGKELAFDAIKLTGDTAIFASLPYAERGINKWLYGHQADDIWQGWSDFGYGVGHAGLISVAFHGMHRPQVFDTYRPSSGAPNLDAEFKANYQDHYAVLGISPNASAAEITRQWRKLSFENHPDRNKDRSQEDLIETMKKINLAYDTLGNLERRARYDEFYKNYKN